MKTVADVLAAGWFPVPIKYVAGGAAFSYWLSPKAQEVACAMSPYGNTTKVVVAPWGGLGPGTRGFLARYLSTVGVVSPPSPSAPHVPAPPPPTPASPPVATDPNCPVFLVGDAVVYELGPGKFPRWNYHQDSGGQGITERAIVDSVNGKDVSTRGPNGRTWFWPLPGHPDYDPAQWGRPGYLRPAGSKAPSAHPHAGRPRNNDGLAVCCCCGAATKKVTLFTSIADICTACGY